jgi:hypothetical protein
MDDENEKREYTFTQENLEHSIGKILNKTDITLSDIGGNICLHPEWEIIKLRLANHIAIELVKEKDEEDAKLRENAKKRQRRYEKIWEKLEEYSHNLPSEVEFGLGYIFDEINYHLGLFEKDRLDQLYTLIECLLDKENLIKKEEKK